MNNNYIIVDCSNKAQIKYQQKGYQNYSYQQNNPTNQPIPIINQMKLNFLALAKQATTTKQQSQSTAISSQLNYYQRSKPQQNSQKQYKQRKTQLQQQESSFSIGSSILQQFMDFNKDKQSSHTSIRQPRVNLSVMYPYEICKSLSPSNIQQQMKEMKVQGILNESAMKFIKKEVMKGLSKSKEKLQQQVRRSVGKNNQNSYLLETNKQLEGENVSEKSYEEQSHIQFLNLTQQSLSISAKQPTLNATTKTLLFKNFSKHSIHQTPNNKNQITQTQTTIIPQTHKRNYQKPTIPYYMNPTGYTSKRLTNTKTHKQPIPTQTLKLQQQLKQLKPKPSLELTSSSPFTQRVQVQRQNKYKTKKQNVFDSLYQQAYVRQCMKSLQKSSVEKDIDQKINMKKTLESGHSKQYKVESTFMERLDKSIERKYYKEYLVRKYQVNEKTGQPFFQPDTTLSKHTYEALFHKSVEKLRTQGNDSVAMTKNIKNHYLNNKQSSKAISSKLTHTLKSVKRTKENSLEKLSQVDRLNQSMQSIRQNCPTIDSRSSAIVEKRNQRVLAYIVGLFYPVNNVGSQQSSKNKQSSQDNFSKTYHALSSLSEQQYHILSPLLQLTENLQQFTRVTSLMFRNLLSQFFKRLNYYDQLVLVKNVEKRVKRKMGNCKEQDMEESIQMEQSLDGGSIYHSGKKVRDQHCPKINWISASMEKLNPKYDEALYYV